MIRVLGLTVLVALAFGGCGPGAGASGTTTPITGVDGSFATCDTETRATPYTKGMQVTSVDGTRIVKLLESKPGPPVKGTNTWTVEVDDATTGTPLDGLPITVAPYMPDHLHGTTPVGVTPAGPPAGLPAGSGTYTLDPMYLYMSGFWQVKMNFGVVAVVDSGPYDAMIPICIP